jgi:hypothetical protein
MHKSKMWRMGRKKKGKKQQENRKIRTLEQALLCISEVM